MKTAIVTGASGNLGLAVAKKFIAKNYRVTGTVTTALETSIDSTNFEPVVIDLADEKASRQMVDTIINKFKTIDVAVLTVGGFAMGSIADTSIADIQKQVKINFETAYNVARPVFESMMKKKEGRMFLIGSKPGYDMHNSKKMVAYGLAKSMIFHLAELMNDEAKDTHVVTHVIVPSTIDTPQNRKAMPDADFSKWVKPEAIADVIYFYCTSEASLIKEPVIKVYGDA